MKYVVGAMMISALIFFLIALFVNGIGVIPSQSILKYGWVAWGVLMLLCYPLAKKIMA
ncbi:hypothetical protein [Psychrobacter sp. TB55-MNA-CIBAN-0194]|uniref:hypothetical protein n=1 Tax=Psychrobacter sp. TB55-MNA-CIBAN-0194 TaxID=3140445 RepID=UPI003324BF51